MGASLITALLVACSQPGPTTERYSVHVLYTEATTATIHVGNYVQIAAVEGARNHLGGFYWVNRAGAASWTISNDSVLEFGIPSPQHWPGVKYAYGLRPGTAEVCAEYESQKKCVTVTVEP